MHAYDIFVYVFRWLLAIVFGGLGWWIIAANFHGVYLWLVRREHHSPMPIPVIAGLFALAGMNFCPIMQVRKLAWVPLVIDVGFFVTVMTIGLLMQFYEARKKKHDA